MSTRPKGDPADLVQDAEGSQSGIVTATWPYADCG
jgi:hypothetical protein